MIKEVIATGKDVAEAKENAIAALAAGEMDDVQFEILHMGSRGIFGIIGVKPAQVRAFIEIPDRQERPRRERNPRHERDNAPKEDTADVAEAPAEGTEEAPKAEGEGQKKSRRRRRNKKGRSQTETAAPEKTSAPKERVVPEVELHLEPKTVEEGEDMSFDFIKTVVRDIGLDASVELYSCDDGTRRITVSGPDASTLIGHHGDTLDALQYLANLASARKNIHGERDKSRVTIDIEGYRAKREETLRALARRMAQKALRNKRSVMLEPMSAYERRIIHSEVQGIEGVSTNSIGSDNNRKIVIYLTDKKPQGIFEENEETELEATAEVAEAVESEAEITVEVVAETKADEAL